MISIKHFQILLFFWMSPLAIFAQGHPILNRFDVFEVNETVQIICVLSSGNTCNGIDVLRSNDSLNYTVIGSIPGICGSTTAPVRYDFVDDKPLVNQTSYYKLELGGVGITKPISISVRDIKENELRIQPNPAHSFTTIYFDNPLSTLHTLEVIGLKGEIIIQQNSSTDFFKLIVTNLPSGVYTLKVYNEKSDSKKLSWLVIQH